MQTRNVGIDAARAVALVAMMVAHLTVQDGITAQVLFLSLIHISEPTRPY